MNGVDRLLGSVDGVQQRSRWLGFPFAVMGKFRNDHGGALTTVIAYNAFFALFPLLLIAEVQSWCSAAGESVGAVGCRRGKQERSLRKSSASRSKARDGWGHRRGSLFPTLKEQGLTPARTLRQSRGADRPGGLASPGRACRR
jgi:hypothetical protein